MQKFRFQNINITKRAPHIIFEPFLPARHCRKSPRTPRIVRRRPVHQDHFKPVGDQGALCSGRGKVIGKQDLHRFKPSIGRRCEPVEIGQFSPQQAQVRSKFQHDSGIRQFLGRNDAKELSA